MNPPAQSLIKLQFWKQLNSQIHSAKNLARNPILGFRLAHFSSG